MIKQTFKTAFSTARRMREAAVGQAEFSAEHGRYFVADRFTTDVRIAAGVYPHCGGEKFRAANAAAEIVAAQVARSATATPTLQDRLAARRAAEVYEYI